MLFCSDGTGRDSLCRPDMKLRRKMDDSTETKLISDVTFASHDPLTRNPEDFNDAYALSPFLLYLSFNKGRGLAEYKTRLQWLEPNRDSLRDLIGQSRRPD